MSTGIFDGVTVLELGPGSIPAMLAGVLLADNGARVVRVEPPGGDRSRTTDTSRALVLNRGKESLVADLKTAAGQETFRSWASASDVVIDGLRPGRTRSWQISYDELAIARPDIVYCAITGFGSHGQLAELPGYEHIVQAKAGFFTLGAGGMFAYRPGPIFVNAPMASTGAGMHAAAGIAAALRVRELTGRGQFLETSLVQGLEPTDYFGTAMWQWEHQRFPVQEPASTTSAAHHGVAASRYAFMPCTADGRWVYFTAMLRHQTEAVLRAMDLMHLLGDPRFAGAPQFADADHAQAFEDAIWERFRTRTFAEWDPLLRAEADVAFELARTSEEGLDHPQAQHNGEVVTIRDPEHGPVEQVGPLVRFAGVSAPPTRSAPALDDHGAVPVSPVREPRSAPATMPEHPLAGVTILEFGYFYAMPYGLTLAAALGARVIKIEDRRGDPMRFSFGPPEIGGMKTMQGKESLSVDLRTEEGRRIVHELAARADVFVDGFRPGVANRQQLDRETLARLNPDLIYVHAAGYGESGPYASRPLYAQCASAIAGSLYRQASVWMDPSATEGHDVPELQAIVQPRLRAQTDGDSNAALGVFVALCFALLGKARGAEVTTASTSMVGSNLWGYIDDAVRYEGKPALRATDEEFLGLHALYRLYETSAGWVFLAAAADAEWSRLAEALGHPELLDDPRFSTGRDRAEHDEELAALLTGIFAAGSAAAYEDKLTSARVACVKVYEDSNSSFTNTDPVLRELGLVREVDHPLWGRTLRTVEPVQFSLTPGRVEAGTLVGQNTRPLLEELGYAPDRIQGLLAAGVVQSAD